MQQATYNKPYHIYQKLASCKKWGGVWAGLGTTLSIGDSLQQKL